jgi:hypothetical protein
MSKNPDSRKLEIKKNIKEINKKFKLKHIIWKNTGK